MRPRPGPPLQLLLDVALTPFPALSDEAATSTTPRYPALTALSRLGLLLVFPWRSHEAPLLPRG